MTLGEQCRGNRQFHAQPPRGHDRGFSGNDAQKDRTLCLSEASHHGARLCRGALANRVFPGTAVQEDWVQVLHALLSVGRLHKER